MPSGGWGVSRRAVLGFAPAALLAGCSKDEPRLPPPLPDVAVLTGAITAEQGLIALYEAALRAHADLARRLDPLLAHHREHSVVLRRHYVAGTGTPTRVVTPSPGAPPTMPEASDEVLELLRSAENGAAVARMNDVQRMAAGMAQLMASIGACEAAHVALLTEDGR